MQVRFLPGVPPADDTIIISAAKDAGLEELYGAMEQADRIRRQATYVTAPMIEPGTVSGRIIHLKAIGWTWKGITEHMAEIMGDPDLTQRQVMKWAKAAGWSKETTWRYETLDGLGPLPTEPVVPGPALRGPAAEIAEEPGLIVFPPTEGDDLDPSD